MIKQISGYENYYIEDDGNVYRKMKNGDLRKLSPYSNGKDRMKLRISNEDGAKYFYVHTLVCSHFVEKVPTGMTVNHIDGNTLNNHYTNLEVVTIEYNQYHAIILGLNNVMIEVYDVLTNLWCTFFSMRAAAKFFGFSDSYFQEIRESGNERFKVKVVNTVG